MLVYWVGLRGRGILAVPKGRDEPIPLVIAQHGIGSSPERVFGLDDPADIYKGYGRRLVEEGFAVIAPMNVSGGPPRARLERLCKLLGKTLWGLEVYRTQRLLDFLETRSEIDVGRTAMYGISLGGAYTMFTVPLEPRISAAVVCAWFNERRHKMAIDDPRYSCFLSVDEEHIWIPGLAAGVYRQRPRVADLPTSIIGRAGQGRWDRLVAADVAGIRGDLCALSAIGLGRPY